LSSSSDSHNHPAPLVGVIMGSITDWSVMEHASLVLTELGIPHETKIVSAHRTPAVMAEYAATASARGLRAIIAGAGGAAHLPGMVAAQTLVPVLGVPVPATALQGVDALHSIVQMPAGVPVATFAIGKPGAINAALFAAALLAATDPVLSARLATRRTDSAVAALAAEAQLPFAG
jgi:5-(carboxyamino)imidazole ribonucleotide mutase